MSKLKLISIVVGQVVLAVTLNPPAQAISPIGWYQGLATMMDSPPAPEPPLAPKLTARRSCQPGPTTLCLNDGRFEIEVEWRTSRGLTGAGQAIPLTRDTGYFWFFDPDNVEMLIKVLDACSFNNRFWVFAAGLTDVFVEITVTDTMTGDSKKYRNPQGSAFEPIQDTQGFANCPKGAGSERGFVPKGAVHTTAAATAEALEELSKEARRPALALGTWRSRAALEDTDRGADANKSCAASPTALCLKDSRFRVEVLWETNRGSTGMGRAVRLTNDTGYFWFFDPDNVEMLIKVVDACSFNDRFWVFAAGLTDTQVEITVTDTVNGTIARYVNPQGSAFRPIQDTKAFLTCQGALPDCTARSPAPEDLQGAVVEALGVAPDPFGDVTDFRVAVRMTEARVGCHLGTGSEAELLPFLPRGKQGCAASGVNYCGPGTSRTTPILSLVHVPGCLNEGCCEHDSCYGADCVQAECFFTPQSQDCDDPLLAICRGRGSCGRIPLLHPGALFVCAIAECLNGTPVPPTPGALTTCNALRAAHLIAFPQCAEPPSRSTCNIECAGQTCNTFTTCNPGSGCSQPVCATLAEGGGACVEGDTRCSTLSGCRTSDDCAGGLCLVDTCCDRPVCVNVAHYCPDIGAEGVSSPRATFGEPTIGQPR